MFPGIRRRLRYLPIRLRYLLFERSEPIEVLLSGFALGWAVMLLLREDTLARSVNFSVMLSFMSEDMWGLSALLIFFFSAIAGFFNDFRWRSCAMLTHAFFWALITFLVAKTNIVNQGVAVYGCTTVAALWAAIRNGYEQGRIGRRSE